MSLEDQLYKIFSNVNDWLKFSEAKNAMIIAFNGASVYGITKTFDLEKVKGSSVLSVYLLIVITLLTFSTICSLISFAPQVRIIKGGWYAPDVASNIFFFEYLKTKTAIGILKEVSRKHDGEEFSNIEKDLAEQIRQNSIIASRKYSYFTISVWISIAAYITVPLALIFCLYTYCGKKQIG